MEKIKIEDLRNDMSLFDGVHFEKYVPIAVKEAMIEKLVEILVKSDEHGILRVNSIEKEIMTKIAIVMLYSNIEVSDLPYDDYDTIMEYGIYEVLYEFVSKERENLMNDVEDFIFMLDCRIDDKLKENSIEYMAARKADDVVAIIDNTMNHVNGMLDKGDPNTIAKHLSKGIEMIAKKLPDFSKVDITKPIKEQLS